MNTFPHRSRSKPAAAALALACLLFTSLACGFSPAATQAPNVYYPAATEAPVVYLTPASLEPIIAPAYPVEPISNDDPIYEDWDLGIYFYYPSDWTVRQTDLYEVGVYPPGSNPDVPTPMIRIQWLQVPYTQGQPLVSASINISPITVAGLDGQQYLDSRMALPSQNRYIELPYWGGVLFITATMGPEVNLSPKLDEILKTFTLLGLPLESRNVVFDYPVEGQVLGYYGNFLFRVLPVDGAEGYHWLFFQNGQVVWDGLAEDGNVSGTMYNIMQGTDSWNRFEPGYVQVVVLTSTPGQDLIYGAITILLEP